MADLDGCMSAWLVVLGVGLAGASGLPGLFVSRASAAGGRLATALMIVAAACGVSGAALALVQGPSTIELAWSVPNGAFAIEVDAISAMFLLQIFVIALLGSIYGLGYWPQAEHPRDGRKLRAFYGILTAGMALLVAAKNTMLFLAGWEVMALAAFITLTSQDDQPAVRDVGYVYIVATRVGTLSLFAMFALLSIATGGFTFAAPLAGTSPAVTNAIFVLAVLGFGLKAGVMPMHIWLPGAHASAPSHVSALMSGVLIKTGIYGLVRLCSLFAQPPSWWGWVVLGLGVVSGVLGVAFAIGQHDLKRLLAYHSVENIGIICIGLGVALLGRSFGRNEIVALGLAGALLHVWNHGLFKALLFLAAGAVLHATGTREMDKLGGLAKRMPWTALGFLIGAVAICGLPPLNGFVSELLVYLGLFRSVAYSQENVWLAGALGAPALALIGALAAACFVKAYGTVFLGEGRSAHTKGAHEAPATMLGPMALLALACIFIGVVPPLVAPVLDAAVGTWAPELAAAQPPLNVLAPLAAVSLAAALLILSLAVTALVLRARLRAAPQVQSCTWDCGYAAPGATMQYTSSSFAQTLVGLFSWSLRPEVHAPRLRAAFPRPEGFHSHVPDTVLDRIITPAVRFGARATQWLKWLQHGSAHAYLVYVLITLFVLLLWR